MLSVLADLRAASALAGFYLAGGTGLALRLGHRRSIDLDFFSAGHFAEEALLQRVQSLEGFSLVSRGDQTIHAEIRGTKVSFLGFPYPLLFPPQEFEGVPVADPRDIACMKISAIAGCGARRDFIDLYVVAREHGLQNLLDLFHRKFAQANYSRPHLLKSLCFFEDAEKDPLPEMLVPLAWPEVTNYFLREAPRLL